MTNPISVILPAVADNTVRGMMFPVYLFTVIAVISTLRSLVHMFSPDGGAGSIAGMNLNVEGAKEIAFSFALWGSAQLVYAFVQLLVAFRYRSLVPLMFLLLIAEASLRILVGRIKPVKFAHRPPGAIGNWIAISLALAMLFLSFDGS